MLQHLGAGLGVEGALRASALKERMRDEITAENGEIRLLREGESNGTFYLRLAGVGPEVEIAEEGDAKSMEGFRQTLKADSDLVSNGSMGLDQETIDCGGGGYPSREQRLSKKSSTIQKLHWPRSCINYSFSLFRDLNLFYHQGHEVTRRILGLIFFSGD